MYQRIQNLVPGVIKKMHETKIYHTNFLYRVLYHVFNCFFLFLYPFQGLKSDIELSRSKRICLGKIFRQLQILGSWKCVLPKIILPGTSGNFLHLYFYGIGIQIENLYATYVANDGNRTYSTIYNFNFALKNIYSFLCTKFH